MTTLIELQGQIRTFVEEPVSIKSFTCKERIISALTNSPAVAVGMGSLRGDCKVYCYDYSEENFNAALNDLMRERSIRMVGLNSFTAI